MTQDQADSLLDDFTTDGKQIYFDKIEEFGNNLSSLQKKYMAMRFHTLPSMLLRAGKCSS